MSGVAREVVEVVKCDCCGAPDARPFFITVPDSREQREVDLCSEHDKVLEQLYARGHAVKRGPRRRSGGSMTHRIEPID